MSKKKNPPRQAPMQLTWQHSIAPSAAPSAKYQSVHKSPISHEGGTRCRMPICAMPWYGLPHHSLAHIPQNASTPPPIKAQSSVRLLFF